MSTGYIAYAILRNKKVVVVVKAAVEADAAKATLEGSQQPRETNREAEALIMFLRNKKS